MRVQDRQEYRPDRLADSSPRLSPARRLHSLGASRTGRPGRPRPSTRRPGYRSPCAPLSRPGISLRQRAVLAGVRFRDGVGRRRQVDVREPRDVLRLRQQLGRGRYVAGRGHQRLQRVAGVAVAECSRLAGGDGVFDARGVVAGRRRRRRSTAARASPARRDRPRPPRSCRRSRTAATPAAPANGGELRRCRPDRSDLPNAFDLAAGLVQRAVSADASPTTRTSRSSADRAADAHDR